MPARRKEQPEDIDLSEAPEAIGLSGAPEALEGPDDLEDLEDEAIQDEDDEEEDLEAEDLAEAEVVAPADDDDEEEDGSTSLDALLAKRAADRRDADDEDDDEDLMSLASERDEPIADVIATRVVPMKDRQEFVCNRCHLVKAKSQLADAQRGLCRDCV